MVSSRAHDVQQFFAIALVIIFPSVVLIVDHGASTVLGLLSLMGIVLLCVQPKRNFSAIEYGLLIAVSVYLGSIIINYLFTEVTDFELRRLKRYLRFILIFPLLYTFHYLRLEVKHILYAVFIGACVVGGNAIYELLVFTASDGAEFRARGNTHPIIYGNVALILSAMSFAGLYYVKNSSHWIKAFAILAALLGAVASILSSARGAWIALPAYIVLFLIFYWQHLTTKLKITAILLSVLLPVLLYMIPQTGIQQRFDQAQHDIQQYLTGDMLDTSLGSRFELWGYGWQVFKAHPIIGDGPAGVVEKIHAAVAEGKKTDAYMIYNEPHNDYIRALASFGTVGLCGLLTLYGVLSWIFFKAMKNKNIDVVYLGLVGQILIVGYVVFGFSASALDYTRSIVFFVFFIALLTALIANQKTKQKNV